MASSAGKLVVEILATTAAFQSDLGKASAAAETHARRIDKAIAGVKQSIVRNLEGVGAAIGIPLGGAALISLFEDIKTRAGESERSIAQLGATLAATGGASGLTAQNLREVGEALKGSSIFSDEDIRKAESALLRFRSVQKDVFEGALKAAADVAAVQGAGLPAAAELVGRFISAPQQSFRQLKALGIQLSESQASLAERLIETGHAAEGQKLALDELNRATGGQAVAQTEGLAGASDKLARAISHIKIAIGKQIFDPQVFQTAANNAETLAKRLSTGEESLLGVLLRIGKAAFVLTYGGLIPSFAEKGPIASAAETLFPNLPPSRSAGGKIGGAQSSADIDAEEKKKVATFKDAVERASAEQLAALQKRAETAASYYASELLSQKAFLDNENAQIRFGYERGTVTTEEFFARQRELADSNFEAIQSDLVKQSLAQGKLLAALDTRGGPENEAKRQAIYARDQLIINQGQAAFIARSKTIADLDRQETIAVEQLGDAYAELGAKLAEAQGKTALAASIRFEKELRDRQRAASTGNPAAILALERTEAIGKIQISQASLNDATRSYDLALGRVGVAQERLNILQQSGGATELDSLRAQSQLNQAFIPLLETRLALAEKIAQKSGTEEDLLAVDRLKVKLEELKSTGDLVAKTFNKDFAGSFSDAIVELTSGTKKFRDVLLDLGKSIEGKITKRFADQISDRIFAPGGPGSFLGDFFSKSVVGDAGGAAALSGAGVTLSTAGVSLTGAATALYGAAGVLSAGGAAGALGAIGGSDTFGLGSLGLFQGAFAEGTPSVPRTGLALVHKGEAIIPAKFNQGAPATAGGRHTTIHMPINITVPGGTSTATAAQTAREVGLAVRRELRAAGMGA